MSTMCIAFSIGDNHVVTGETMSVITFKDGKQHMIPIHCLDSDNLQEQKDFAHKAIDDCFYAFEKKERNGKWATLKLATLKPL